jgi:hypothetical protein
MRRSTPILVLFTLAACDLPSRAPQWDVEWNVPAATSRMSVASLLPSTIATVADSSAFVVSVAPLSVVRQLGSDCAQCTGVVAPKPEFTMSSWGSTTLPAELLSATLDKDTLAISIASTLSFDPLRPSASASAPRGWMKLVVSNGSFVVGVDSVNGSTLAIPAGATVLRRIPLVGSVSASSPIRIDATLYSPAGDPVAANPSETVTLSAAAPNMRVSSVQVSVVGRNVSANPMEQDLRDITSDVTDRVQYGSLIFSIDNPVSVQGTLAVRLTAPGVTIDKTMAVAPGATVRTVEFTRDELRSLFGKTVTVSVSGPVSSTGTSVQLTPKQVIAVTTRLDIVLNTSAGN